MRAGGILGVAAIALGCSGTVDVGTGTTSTTATGTGAGGGTGGSGGTVATGAGGSGGSATSGGGPPGSCVESSDCTAQNGPCTQGLCADGVCVAVPANQLAACDDGKGCTLDDACQNGTCAGTMMTCNGGGGCQVAVCDEDAGGCTVKPADNGASCDDGDPCTSAGKCQSGACQKGLSVDCGLLDTPCTKGACDPVMGCVAVPVSNGLPCEDGQFCTMNDSCQAGACAGGQPLQCGPPSGCFVSVCDEAANMCTAIPGNDGAACDDGNACTAGTVCAAGVCLGGGPANDGVACDDGASCTSGEFCTAGTCGGGQGPVIYFSDDFHDNLKGWTLGQDWQIGPAMASAGGVGSGDPAADHSASNDNGVAGVVIGGNAPTNQHPFYYLESPAFDTSGSSGQLILGFYRSLNSDYAPFMQNRIDVYNGSQWITIWTSGGPPPVNDAQWTFVQHNLAAYKNPEMRLRFGFNVGQANAFEVGSWTIDDVLVASAACP
jgi:hypothetical protein